MNRTIAAPAHAGVPLPRRRRLRFIDLFTRPATVRLLISATIAAFTALGVTALVSEGSLLGLDGAVQDAVIGARTGWLDQAMVSLTFLGDRIVIGSLTFVLVAWSLVTGRQRGLVAVIVGAVLINPLIEHTFKELVGRARPDVARLLPGNGPSFPSGHVVATVGFYGMLPFLVWRATTQRVQRFLALTGASAVIVTVAVSRVYLDVHWATDVAAGLLLGTAVVAATWQAFLRLERRQPGVTVTGPVTPVLESA